MRDGSSSLSFLLYYVLVDYAVNVILGKNPNYSDKFQTSTFTRIPAYKSTDNYISFGENSAILPL